MYSFLRVLIQFSFCINLTKNSFFQFILKSVFVFRCRQTFIKLICMHAFAAVVMINHIAFEARKSQINPFTHKLFKIIHSLVRLDFKF